MTHEGAFEGDLIRPLGRAPDLGHHALHDRPDAPDNLPEALAGLDDVRGRAAAHERTLDIGGLDVHDTAVVP